MAIYHCSVKIGKRGTGQSAIAAAAYRSGTKLYEEETGLTADYSRKRGVIFSEISLCKNAPEEYTDRKTLWNAVQKVETASDARLWREIEVALPVELSLSEQVEVVREYVRSLTEQGMCADWSIHDKDNEIPNPHAHIMLTTRSILENGKWAPKAKKVYERDENGEKIPLIDKETGLQKVDKNNRKQWKCHKEDYNDWNDKERVEEWRAAWAEYCNRFLPEDKKIDHRSYERQGVEQIPTIHEGYVARQMAARGKVSERVEINNAIRQANAEIERNDPTLEVMKEYAAKADNVVQLRNTYLKNSQLFADSKLRINVEKINLEREAAKAEKSVKLLPKIATRVRGLLSKIAECGILSFAKKKQLADERDIEVGNLKKHVKILEKIGVSTFARGEAFDCSNPEKWFVDEICKRANKRIAEIRAESSAERAILARKEQGKVVTPQILQSDLQRFQSVCETLPILERGLVAIALKLAPRPQAPIEATMKADKVISDNNLHVHQLQQQEQHRQYHHEKGSAR